MRCFKRLSTHIALNELCAEHCKKAPGFWTSNLISNYTAAETTLQSSTVHLLSCPRAYILVLAAEHHHDADETILLRTRFFASSEKEASIHGTDENMDQNSKDSVDHQVAAAWEKESDV
jgi:hypothetical protein